MGNIPEVGLESSEKEAEKPRGSLFEIFKRKKKNKEGMPPEISEEEVVSPDEMPPSGEEVQEEEREQLAVGVMGSNVHVKLERLSAQIQALGEIREATIERFSRVSEQIGELRNAIVEGEKRRRDLEIKATKAADLVEEVQPQQLMAVAREQESKQEASNAKIDALQYNMLAIIEELKNIKNTISTFRGTESILKLNEDIKKELFSIQKLKAITEQHADKIEQIFIQTQKDFFEFQRFSARVSDLDASFKDVSKEVERTTVKLAAFLEKKDFSNFKNEVDDILSKIQTAVANLEKSQELVAQLVERNNELVKFVEKNSDRIAENERKFEDVLIVLEEMQRKIELNSERIEELPAIKAKPKMNNKHMIDKAKDRFYRKKNKRKL